MTKEVLIIFVKNPELGKVKTRLAATVGNEKALEIYKLLLSYTKKITESLPQDKWVFYSDKVTSGDIWDDNLYHKEAQSVGDLGQKMLAAFKHCFDRGYEKVSIIGSDTMDINASILQRAFSSLENQEVVIGPAQDGGYYLLGMNKLYSSLFKNKKWSTESVFKNTVSDIERQGLSYCKLEKLHDIDTESDWKTYLKT